MTAPDLSDVAEVFSISREQMQAHLKSGKIDQLNFEFSTKLIEATEKLIKDGGLAVTDAMVILTMLGAIMGLAQGAVDMKQDKNTPLAKRYFEASLSTVLEAMRRGEHRADSAKPAATDASFTDFDLPPGGKLQ